MQPGGILLCAVDTDDRAPNLIATARTWAAATRCRAVFVHGCAAAADAAARSRFTALGVAEDERLLEEGDAPAVIAAAAARTRPALLLIASSANGDARLGRVAGAVLREDGTALAIVPGSAGGTLSDKTVVCAVSLGRHDEAAVRFAHAFTAIAGARLALRPVLGSRDAVLLAAERARASVAVPAPRPTEADARSEVLAQRLVDIARDANPSVLVIASRPGDPASLALRTDTLWSTTPCPVIVIRP